MFTDYMHTFPPDSHCSDCGCEMYENPNDLCNDCVDQQSPLLDLCEKLLAACEKQRKACDKALEIIEGMEK